MLGHCQKPLIDVFERRLHHHRSYIRYYLEAHMDKRTVASAHERIDEMQIQVAEIRTEVKIQLKEVFARVKRLEAIMIGASASIIAMLVMVLTRMP